MDTLVELSARLERWEALSFNRRAIVGSTVTELAELCLKGRRTMSERNGAKESLARDFL